MPQRLAVTATGASRSALGAPARCATSMSAARFLYGAAGRRLRDPGRGAAAARRRTLPAVQGLPVGRRSAHAFEEKFVELGTTSPTATAALHPAIPRAEAGDTAQPLQAAVTASVFEPGGRPVREGLSLKVRTKPVYLGRQGRPGRRRRAATPPMSLDIIAVNAAGRRIAAHGVTYTPDLGELGLRLVPAGRPLAVAAHQPRRGGRPRRRSTSAPATPRALQPPPGLGRLSPGAGRGRDGARTVIQFSPRAGARRPRTARRPTSCGSAPGPKAYAQGDTVERDPEVALCRRGCRWPWPPTA